MVAPYKIVDMMNTVLYLDYTKKRGLKHPRTVFKMIYTAFPLIMIL